MNAKDYRKYHDLETYLLKEVQPKFARTQQLSTFDFFCIVIWKANRAKSNIANKLLKKKHKNLSSAVKALVSAITASASSEERFRVLVEDWQFPLPTASAILTMLYPSEFTVYDVRVCGVLKGFEDAMNKTKFDSIWREYSAYLEAVRREVPQIKSLREKDRFLWGKSFALQLEKDIKNGFPMKAKKKE